jgi:hypothetical protein
MQKAVKNVLSAAKDIFLIASMVYFAGNVLIGSPFAVLLALEMTVVSIVGGLMVTYLPKKDGRNE